MMTVQIQRTKDIQIKHIKWLIYGNPKTGKTTSAATFGDVDYIRITDRKISDEALEYAIKEDKDHDVIVIDSLTTYSQMELNYITDYRHNAASKDLIVIPELRDWQILALITERLFQLLANVDKHIVITAHEEYEKDEEDGIIKVQPFAKGQQIIKLAKIWFSEIYRCTIRVKGNTREYIWQCQPTHKVIAGSRLGMPPIVAPPTYQRILEILQEKGTSKQPTAKKVNTPKPKKEVGDNDTNTSTPALAL